MSSAPSNPAAPDANTIGKRRQDASESSAPQGDSSVVSSSVESAQSPLLKSPPANPARRILSPGMPNIIMPSDDALQSQDGHFVSRANGVQLDPKLVQLHQLQDQRLHGLGHVMPLNDRLHCLQSGHTLSAYQHTLRNYVANSRRGSAAATTGAPASVSSGSGVSLTAGENRSSWRASAKMSGIDDADLGHCDIDYESEALMRFSLYVEEYTNLVDMYRTALPPGLQTPSCSCDQPCALRSHKDPQFDGACIWVEEKIERKFFEISLFSSKIAIFLQKIVDFSLGMRHRDMYGMAGCRRCSRRRWSAFCCSRTNLAFDIAPVD